MAGLGSLAGQTPRASLAREISLAREYLLRSYEGQLHQLPSLQLVPVTPIQKLETGRLRKRMHVMQLYATCNDYNQWGSTNSMTRCT